eukprot:GHVP01006560.1.p1 GENE.GHVP01006560.1~~GHVP01006560.1.p1  ORF type:complete len:117 (-),score=20.62 GHVP01006560.1:352-660(-)
MRPSRSTQRFFWITLNTQFNADNSPLRLLEWQRLLFICPYKCRNLKPLAEGVYRFTPETGSFRFNDASIQSQDLGECVPKNDSNFRTLLDDPEDLARIYIKY